MTKPTIAERQPLTQERLKEIIHYDPETGIFTWRVKRGRSRAGGLRHSGYHSIRVDDTLYQAHRLAWLYMVGSWPCDEVDHRNRVRDDNRWVNLREATRRENSQNMGRRKGRILPTGVYRHKGKWQAKIKINGKSVVFGSFACIGKAVQARREAKQKLHPFAEASP